MKLNIHNMVYPVTALGPGRRLAIWFQGCHVGCRGCMSKNTWDPDDGTTIEVPEFVDLADKCRSLGDLDGITISGGEPFEQPEGLRVLLEFLSDWRQTIDKPIDFLCYSGFRMKRLTTGFPEVLSLLDALIPEPYVGARRTGPLWRGSANQPLVLLSNLGRSRYAEFVDANPVSRPVQVSVDRGSVTVIGVPARGALADLTKGARDLGVEFEQSSWE